MGRRRTDRAVGEPTASPHSSSSSGPRAVYRIPLRASSFRNGLNTVTFRYGYAIAPASVIPGSSDTRTLAVAFDYLVLAPGP